MQMSHENENLKAEIRDLNEKLETLKGLFLIFDDYILLKLIIYFLC